MNGPDDEVGRKIVECQLFTEMTMLKSKETMLCTETNTGRMRADSSMPAITCSFHCLGFPRQPMHSTAYIFRLQPVDVSRMTARSGISATYTNSMLEVR